MNQDRWNSFAIFFVALCLLIAAINLPFAEVYFSPTIPSEVEEAKNWIYRVKQGENILFGSGLSDSVLEKFFGKKLFSAECEPIWDSCFNDWLAEKAGIQVGAVMITHIVLDLAMKQEWILAILVGFFSIVFPFAKCALGIFLSSSNRSATETKRLFKLLETTSKWSLTDPFIIAVMVVMFKADKLNFAIVAEPGIYLFALSGIVSTIGVNHLSKQFGKQIIYTNLDTTE